MSLEAIVVVFNKVSVRFLMVPPVPHRQIGIKLGLRRGPVDHSFNLPYSLELVFGLLGKIQFFYFYVIFLIPDIWYLIPDIWISGYLVSGYLDTWIPDTWWGTHT